MPIVDGLDHLVLTVANIDRSVGFYANVLGMTAEVFYPADGSTRTALKFGVQKINLHAAATPFEPKARHPSTGSADLCFVSQAPLHVWQAHLAVHKVEVILGPITRTGATGPLLSLYVRDPDGNLIEISNYA
jgi:catechol 2,3-dioxygenase-like lactoylglutathione lyase family enzyme